MAIFHIVNELLIEMQRDNDDRGTIEFDQILQGKHELSGVSSCSMQIERMFGRVCVYIAIDFY